MTHTPENVTDEERTEALALILGAICDPGQYAKRDREKCNGHWIYESVPHWGARATMAALDAHPLLEIRRYHPTTSAYEAADKAVWKHRKRADEAEAERDQLAERAESVRAIAEEATAEAARIRSASDQARERGHRPKAARLEHAASVYDDIAARIVCALDGGEGLG